MGTLNGWACEKENIKCFLLYLNNEIEGALNESAKTHVKRRRVRK